MDKNIGDVSLKILNIMLIVAFLSAIISFASLQSARRSENSSGINVRLSVNWKKSVEAQTFEESVNSDLDDRLNGVTVDR